MAGPIGCPPARRPPLASQAEPIGEGVALDAGRRAEEPTAVVAHTPNYDAGGRVVNAARRTEAAPNTAAGGSGV